jgi:superfamily II DNA/RNA helicase
MPRFLRLTSLVRRAPPLTSCFHTTGLTDDLLQAVKQLDINPTNGATLEQRRAINASLEGRHVGLFTGTGSGKTLAYLLPIACRLKADEDFQLQLRQSAIHLNAADATDTTDTTDTTMQFRPEPHRPRAVVLAPSRELCLQISMVAKKLAHNCKLKVVSLDGSGSMSQQKKALESGADIVVGTPGKIQKHRDSGNLYLSKVLCLVLDEADALVKTDFGLDATEIVEALTARDNSEKRSLRRGPHPEKCLFTVVSASAPSSHRLDKLIKKNMPGLEVIQEDKKSRNARRNEAFVHSPVREKYATFLSILKPNESTLVFCNSVASCRSAEHYMREQGHSAVSYHSDMPSSIRTEQYNLFKHQKVKVMVCTDIAARGLDLRHVRHVINLDFPKSKEWYLHRAGRTARAGDVGSVTSIYTKHEKDAVSEIEAEVQLRKKGQDNNKSWDKRTKKGSGASNSSTRNSSTHMKQKQSGGSRTKKGSRGVKQSNTTPLYSNRRVLRGR